MADLEDFFAKRDKKKSSKKKFDTAEDLAKVLDQKAKEKKKLETGKSQYLPEGGRQSPGPGLPAQDGDEWIEAEELEPDFSNLKIQELILSSDDDVDENQQNKEENDDANEGPWHKKTKKKSKDKEEGDTEGEDKDTPSNEKETEESTENKTDGDIEEGSKDAEKKEEEGAAPKKYIPPSMRNKQPDTPSSVPMGSAAFSGGGGVGGGAYVPPSRRLTPGTGPTLAPIKKKVGAPTLGDEESFPSLG